MLKSLAGAVIATVILFNASATAQEDRFDVPYVPTKQEIVEEMLTMANVTGEDILYDLGCGDGRIVVTAAEKWGTRGIGIDINPKRIAECLENAKTAKVTDLVQFVQMDLFKADFSDATVITMYLLPWVNMTLRPRLLNELKPGSRIVSHDFDMGDWKADTIARHEMTEYGEYHTLYFWIIPANVTGDWVCSMPDGDNGGSFTMQVDQEFQQVFGVIDTGDDKVTITDAELNGTALKFTTKYKDGRLTGTSHYEGRVEGDTIRGTMATSSGSHTWIAKRNPTSKRLLDSNNKR